MRQSSEANCAASVCGVDCVASVRRGRLCCVSQARQTVQLQRIIAHCNVCQADCVRQSSEANCAASVCEVDCVASVRRGRLCCVSQARQTVQLQRIIAHCNVCVPCSV